jgi:hypothetical protein
MTKAESVCKTPGFALKTKEPGFSQTRDWLSAVGKYENRNDGPDRDDTE